MTSIENIYDFLNKENEINIDNYLSDKDIDYDELLIKKFWEGLHYFFDDDKDDIKKFISNQKVKLPNRWKIILNYPSKLMKFMKEAYTITDLSDEVIDILHNNKINNIRTLNPFLFIFCYKQLSTKIEIFKIENKDTYIIKYNGKKVRPQYYYTFSIFYHLLTNEKIDIMIKEQKRKNKFLFASCLEKIYYNMDMEKIIITESLQDNARRRYNDICIGIDMNIDELDKFASEKILIDRINKEKFLKKLNEDKDEYYNTLIIEINEDHHLPFRDEDRKISIYEKTGKLNIQFTINQDNFKEFMKKIYKEISSILYKNYDIDLGVLFYMCVIQNFDYDYALYFLNIHNKTFSGSGIKFNDVISIFNGKLKNEDKFIKSCFEELDDEDKTNFIEFNEDEPRESILSSSGVDIVIGLPRKKECTAITEIKETYTKFREGFFTFINDSLSKEEEQYTNIVLNRINELNKVIEAFVYPSIKVFMEKISEDDIENYRLSQHLHFIKFTKNKFYKEGISTKLLINCFGKIPNFDSKLEKMGGDLQKIPECTFVNSDIVYNVLSKNNE
jgi:hypothetical protein